MVCSKSREKMVSAEMLCLLAEQMLNSGGGSGEEVRGRTAD